MKINKITEANTLTIQIDGKLDTTTAPQLGKELEASLSGVTKLIFDFKDLEYISSAGLRIILSLQKRMNNQGSILIKNANDEVKEVFEITGFSTILTIE
mgnify:CR=1 FL=1